MQSYLLRHPLVNKGAAKSSRVIHNSAALTWIHVLNGFITIHKLLIVKILQQTP